MKEGPVGSGARTPGRNRVWLRIIVLILALGGFGGHSVFMYVTRVQWKTNLDTLMADLDARGETLDITALAPPPLPPEENAAEALESIFRYSNSFENRIETRYRNQELIALREWRLDDVPSPEREVSEALWNATKRAAQTTPAEHVALYRKHQQAFDEYLMAYEPVLDATRAAVQGRGCQYAVEWERHLAADTPHYLPLRTLARALLLRTTARTVAGQADAAMADVVQVTRLARTLDGEPLLVSFLVRDRLNEMACSAAQVALAYGHTTPLALREAGNAFAAENSAVDLAHALRGERALGYAEMARWSTDAGLNTNGDSDTPAPTWMVRAWQADWLQTMDQAIAAADMPYREALRVWAELVPHRDESTIGLLTWFRELPRAMTAIFLPALRHGVPYQAAARAQLRTAAIGCYRAADMAEGGDPFRSLADYPPELRTDPFSGTDLRLLLLDNSLVIYSVGPNMQDDGGVNEAANPRGDPAVKDDIAFWVPLPHAEVGG